jgi:hypothetical protein
MEVAVIKGLFGPPARLRRQQLGLHTAVGHAVRRSSPPGRPDLARCAAGCHLNKKLDDLIRTAGFELRS